MRSLRLRRAAGLALALVAVTTSCSTFKVQSEVAIKKVPIDLTFGVDTKKLEPLLPPDIDLPDQGVIDLPTIRPFEPEPEPEVDLCPAVATNEFARDQAPASISGGDFEPGKAGTGNEPREGNYLFRFEGNYEEEPANRMIGYKSVSSASIEGSDGEFAFYVEDGFNGMKIFYEARPIVETESNPSPGGADGLFLKRIDWPLRTEGGEMKRFSFIPTPMLQILDFPIEPGREIVTTGHDVANKRETGVPDVPAVSSSNNMRLTSTVGNRDQFDVCENQAQAWPVNWNLEISGDFNLQMIGTFWMATQYGGWPIKEEYILLRDDAVTSDPLITGNFSSSMMKLDPGDYI